MPVRLAFCGLAHSHPFTDAMNAAALGADVTGVTDPDPARRREFAKRFGCREHHSIAQLCAEEPDVIIATVHPDDMLHDAALLATCGIPVFFNKVVAATKTQLAAWERAVSAFEAQTLGTSSVLRFAPALEQLRRTTAEREILAIRVVAQHDNAPFQAPGRQWQDDPTSGGGTLITVGVHAWEMVDVLLPGAELSTAIGWTRRRSGSSSASEDAAGINGEVQTGTAAIPVEVLVTGLPGPDRYAVEVVTSDGLLAIDLDVSDANIALGFDGLARSLVSVVPDRRLPVMWDTARTVVANTIRAAEIARRGSSSPHERRILR